MPAVREIADYARQFKIVTSVENHGFFIQRSARVEKLITTVDRPNYGSTVDIGNFLCVDEKPLPAVRRTTPFAKLVHVKDFHIKPKTAPPPGEGFFKTTGGNFLRCAILGHGQGDVVGCLKIIYRLWCNAMQLQQK